MKNCNMKKIIFFLLVSLLFSFFSCKKSLTEKDFEVFIKKYEKKIVPLQQDLSFETFNAAISGSDKDYKKVAELKIKLTKFYSNKKDFELVESLKKQNVVKDKVLIRELEEVYNEYLLHQVEEDKMKEMILLSKNIEQKYNTFRAKLSDEELTDNEIDSRLENSNDPQELEAVWKASKQVGNLIAEDMIKLVKMRNASARSIGFKNYHDMKLILSGQEPKKIDEIYKELDLLTKDVYSNLKDEVDEYLSSIYKIELSKLRPWHYQSRFFQDAPNIYEVDFDEYFTGKDIVLFAKNYFSSVGLNIESILSKSHLYEQSGKSQFSGAFNIDRNGDVRILANIKDKHSSMYTMLYETAFAVCQKDVDKKLPFSLRLPSHFIINDGVGTFFSNLSYRSLWLQNAIKIPKEDAKNMKITCDKRFRLAKFIFSRWAQVMYNFEKNLYKNPDQDLNKLWWNLVEKYQKIKRPHNRNEPDWATKAHFTTQACTYHNYMLGELLAAQLHNYISKNILDESDTLELSKNKKIGEFFIEKIFKPGKSLKWEELIKEVTGEELTANYFKIKYFNL